MFDELTDRFEDTLARARRRVSALGDANDALTAAQGRARSADGAVEAVVDGAGLLVTLTLADTVCRPPPARLSAAIVETVRAAASDARLRRQSVLRDLIADLGR